LGLFGLFCFVRLVVDPAGVDVVATVDRVRQFDSVVVVGDDVAISKKIEFGNLLSKNAFYEKYFFKYIGESVICILLPFLRQLNLIIGSINYVQWVPLNEMKLNPRLPKTKFFFLKVIISVFVTM
jgi:hypothetical protein